MKPLDQVRGLHINCTYWHVSVVRSENDRVVLGERQLTAIAGHGKTFPLCRQFPKSGNPLTNEFFFFEQKGIKGWVADDQGEDLTTSATH